MNKTTDREALVKRLKECQQRIGNMCKDGRPPKMRIPAQLHDDDLFICNTINEAIATLTAQGGEQTADTLLRKCHELFTELMDWDSFGRYPKHVIKRVEDVRRELASVQGGKQSDTVSVPMPESQMKNGYFGLTLCFGSTSTRNKAHDMLAAAKEEK